MFVLMVGIILAAFGLAAGGTPRSAFALSCPPDVIYGCSVNGSSPGAGWQVVNSSSAASSTALTGYANSPSGSVIGVQGRTDSPTGVGLQGIAFSTTGNSYALTGNNYSTSGTGVLGVAATTTGLNIGVYAKTNSANGYGVYSIGSNSAGGPIGVYGEGSGPSGKGVQGVVLASSTTSAAIYGVAPSPSSAGYFIGNVAIFGNFSVSNGTKQFKIDHPLDPANKYLVHAAVESPDVMNIYNGNTTTNAEGEATVNLPAYFEALNRDFRYQLTVIGQFAQAIVSSEIKENKFSIKTDKPNVKVSWQVTGIRNDPYAANNPMQVEVDKPANERGTYLYPEGYGQPASLGVNYNELTQIKANAKEVASRVIPEPPGAPAH